MKSYAEDFRPEEGAGLNLKRFAIPHGHQLPRAPVQGELFFLDQEVDGQNQRPTFVRGLYYSPGFGWQLFTEQLAQRKAVPIGSQKIEVEVPAVIANLPTADQGFLLAATSLKVQHRQISVSGVASFWACLPEDGHITASVFRDGKLVALVAEELVAKKARSISITFVDLPGSADAHHTYSLKVNATTPLLYINQAKGFDFDGAAQTAFIIAENN